MLKNSIAITAIMGAVLLAPPARAGQPYSESLVECATLFGTSNRMRDGQPLTDKGRTLAAVEARLLEAAVDQARQEGRGDPQGYVDALVPVKAGNWDAKGLGFVVSQDMRDWASYCHSLSGHLGIKLPRQ